MPISKFVDPKYFVHFTLYALLIAVEGALTVEVLKDLFKPEEEAHEAHLWVAWAVCLVALFVLFKMYDPAVRRLLNTWGGPERLSLTSSQMVRPAKGLVLLVSRREGFHSCNYAVDYHKSMLTHLWLLHSSDQESVENVEKVEAHCRSLGLAAVKVSRRLIENVFSIEMTKAHIDFVRQEAHGYGIADHDLICDFTGMNKPVSAGVVLACVKPEHRLQYMEPRGFLEGGAPDPKAGSVPVEVDVRYDVEMVAEG